MTETLPGRVRPASSADLGALSAALAELPLLVRYGYDAAKLERALRDALFRGEGVIVYDEGAARGLCWFTPTGTLGVGGYLRLLAIAPGQERRGLGSALLKAFEDASFSQSRHAFLLVSDFNRDGQRFYEGHGYTRVGSLPELVLPEVSELIYWKRRPW